MGESTGDRRRRIVGETRTTLDILYDTIPVGVKTEMRTIDFANSTGFAVAVTEDRCRELQSLGILVRHINYGRKDASGKYRVGRFAEWEILVDKPLAIAVLDDWEKEYGAGVLVTASSRTSKARVDARKKPAQAIQATHIPPVEALVIATDDKEVVRAIIGPDRPNPFERLLLPRAVREPDEPAALIEAARQYASRSDKVREHVNALAKMAIDLGITVDERAVMAGINLVPDERLESIALVLPYIDALEDRVDRLLVKVAK